jgi:hypothetical protein
MWTRKTHIASIILLILFVSSMILAISIVPSVFPQENAIFSVSPGYFTAKNVPPLGHPYTIPETIIVWNRDNVARVISITSEIPPEDETTPGYEPIPNENWVRPLPSSVLIKEKSFAQIKISINIPRQENLTGQKWEVWIPLERQPLPGEIGVLRLTVRMDIETTSELPSVRGVTYYLALLIPVILVIVAVVVVAWILSRSKGIKRGRALLRTD